MQANRHSCPLGGAYGFVLLDRNLKAVPLKASTNSIASLKSPLRDILAQNSLEVEPWRLLKDD
jgi:hypothetical protein